MTLNQSAFLQSVCVFWRTIETDPRNHILSMAICFPLCKESSVLVYMVRPFKVAVSLLTLYPLLVEKEMATHSSVLAWRISGTGEPGVLPSMGLHRVGHD